MPGRKEKSVRGKGQDRRGEILKNVKSKLLVLYINTIFVFIIMININICICHGIKIRMCKMFTV